ncbi:unnamed protein product [Dovyalis caffra]|uniref:Endoplasmic reticulum transmembrane protein n=1 Tax=Dovyalis caffra TaxID=77055 RepID=A0AAV1SEX6_9ROSI|nr:unnamed protein product [Dovyalis caffra]
MIQLLYTAIFAEMAVILTLIFKTPLRKLVIMGLDRVKRGRGPVVVKTVAGTILLVLLSNVYSIGNIQKIKIEAGALNPTDEVLMAMLLLQASLLGFLLFLSLMIDRLHHYIRELRLLRKTMEAAKKQNNRGFEEGKNGEVKALGEEVETLRSKIKKLESDCEAKAKEAKAAGAEAEALRKQSEGLLLEYDHLLEDNQSLRNQLAAIDQTSSQSDGKKNM